MSVRYEATKNNTIFHKTFKTFKTDKKKRQRMNS